MREVGIKEWVRFNERFIGAILKALKLEVDDLYERSKRLGSYKLLVLKLGPFTQEAHQNKSCNEGH